MSHAEHGVTIPAEVVSILANATPAQLAEIDPSGLLASSVKGWDATSRTEPSSHEVYNTEGSNCNTKSLSQLEQTHDEPYVRPAKRAKISASGITTLNALPKITRPVNSWMAFRSYYSPVFANFQQKDISGILTYLWETDPFKAKWTVLAKAYSMIRDTLGRQNTRLDVFLAFNAPFIGIIPPFEYLTKLGWELEFEKDGGRALARKEKVKWDAFRPEIISASHTVYDVIQNSYEQGLIPEDGGGFALNRDSNNPTVIAVTQPMMTAALSRPQKRLRSVSDSGDPPDGKLDDTSRNARIQLIEKSSASGAPQESQSHVPSSLQAEPRYPRDKEASDEDADDNVAETQPVTPKDGNTEVLEATKLMAADESMDDAHIAGLWTVNRAHFAESPKMKTSRQKTPKHTQPSSRLYDNQFYPYKSNKRPFNPFEGDKFDTYSINGFGNRSTKRGASWHDWVDWNMLEG